MPILTRVIGKKKYFRIPVKQYKCDGCEMLLKGTKVSCLLARASVPPLCYDRDNSYIYRTNRFNFTKDN